MDLEDNKKKIFKVFFGLNGLLFILFIFLSKFVSAGVIILNTILIGTYCILDKYSNNLIALSTTNKFMQNLTKSKWVNI